MAPLQVVVPPGVVPGQSLQVTVGSNVVVVTVPPGAKPGTILHLQIDQAPSNLNQSMPDQGSAQPQSVAQQQQRPPQPQQQHGSAIEKVAIVIATIVGFIGVIAALVMLSELDLGGEGIVVAVICLIATVCIGIKLRKNLQQPLTPTEDGAMAAVVTLPHAAIFAITIQIWMTMAETGTDGKTVVASGSRALLAVGLAIHLILVLVQARFLRGLGTLFPALAAKTPRGGYITWFSLSGVPVVLLIIGFATWTSLTCNYVEKCDVNIACEYDTSCRENTSRFALVVGGIALTLSTWLSQYSNRGWFVVWCLPGISMIIVIWAVVWRNTEGAHDSETSIDRLSPLLIFPLIAIWISGSAFTSQFVKWSEATTTMLSVSILATQVIFAVTGVHLGLGLGSSRSEERFFMQTTSMLWLTQFIFLPVVLTDRASFPVVSIAFGAGMVGTSHTLVTIPIAAVIGLVVIKQTPRPLELTISELPITGFDELKQPPNTPVVLGEDPPTPNRNRAIASACMPPALAGGYLISSWITAIGAENSLDARLSAIVVVAPALLGAAQLHMHKLSPTIARASIFVSFLGTAGAWTDTTLSLIFSSMLVPCLVAVQSKVKPAGDDDWEISGLSKWGWGIREGVHAVCSVTIFCFLVFHRLSLHWSQPWLYVIGLYIMCWDPLSYSTHKMEVHAQRRSQMQERCADGTTQQISQFQLALCSRSRLWRPGLCGPLLCVIPATFWTMRDEKMAGLCAGQTEQCSDSGLYQLLLLIPVVLLMIEWALDEICISQSQLNDWVSPVACQQIARVSCLLQIGASAFPFRFLLHISEHSNAEFAAEQHYTSNSTEWSSTELTQMHDGVVPSSAYLLHSSGSKTAGLIFTLVLASALILNTILCAVLHSTLRVSVTTRTPRDGEAESVNDMAAIDVSNVGGNGSVVTDDSSVEATDGYLPAPAYVSGVPPTQEMSYALLAIAILDYYTPILLAPLCIAACYTSYVAYMLKQREGKWPTGLLVAVAVWVCKAGIGAGDSTEKARLGIHIFGEKPVTDLHEFISGWDTVWPPMMGTFLLLWGAFVRLKIVQKWPEETVGPEFSWQRLFYCVDAVVFYVAVLLWSEVSNGWMCVILSVAAVAWGFVVRDDTLILRTPALFVVAFLVFEHENNMDFGQMAFFASSVGCVVVAVMKYGLFTPKSDRSGPPAAADLTTSALLAPAVLVDITFLWGIIIAFLDGVDGVTKGGLAFSLVLLLLPGLHIRGYPLLLTLMPLLIPCSFLYCLSCLVAANVIESGDTRAEFIGAIAGEFVALVLLVLSLAQVAPVTAHGASEFKSLGCIMTLVSYHQLLFWSSLTWMYIWVVAGLYVTEYSVPVSLVCCIVIGILNLVLGLQRDGLLLRMSGLLELCVAIWLGATAPGVRGFAQAVLVLVGSFFALGSAGMYFYWMKNENGDQIRPTLSAVADVTPPPELVPSVPQPATSDEAGPLLAETNLRAQSPTANAAEKVSHLTTIEAGVLASSELGLSGGSNILFNALLSASGMQREQFSTGQVDTLSLRLAAAARSLLRETARAPQLYTVEAERLKVRAAANDDASVLRLVGRGATISVISSRHDPVKDQEWFELAIAEAVGGDQLVNGGGWVLAGTGGGISHVKLQGREKSE